MDFDSSTQARSWLFSEATLSECRGMAVTMTSGRDKVSGQARVRKFASGFHGAKARHHSGERHGIPSSNSPPMSPRSSVHPCDIEDPCLTSDDQEILVRFHAHQISMLLGPQAVHPGLTRSSTVLASAIMCFRRFYLSNSVVDFKPRRMAAASALLAAKLEEKRIDIHLLQHATSVVHDRVKSAPQLCCEELEPISLEEIEAAERDLLEGLNYELRCFHPYGAIRVLAADIASFLSQASGSGCHPQDSEEMRDASETSHRGILSPKSVSEQENYSQQLQEKALVISHNALMFTDAPFLFPPGKIAFAAIAIAMRGEGHANAGNQTACSPYLSYSMRKYLRVRFPLKGEPELRDFERQVTRIIQILETNTAMNLNALIPSDQSSHGKQLMAIQAKELRRVMEKVSYLRRLTKTGEGKNERFVSKKRKSFHEEILCSDGADAFAIKVARVTPI